MKIEDIARLANVSSSAVSLALNGKAGVSEETRSRILKIVEEHNYVPLRKSQKKTNQKKKIRFIACKSPDLITEHYQSLPFFNELISYLSSEISEYPYDLVISTFDEESILEELAEVEEEQASAGIILLGTNLSSEQIKEIQEVYQKIVILDTHFPELSSNFVSINNYLGGYQAADYLLNLGHSRIGYVMGIPRIQNFIERKEGFFKRLNENNVILPEKYLFQLPAMEINDGQIIQQNFKNLSEKPTAFFCENDYMAISLIKLFKRLSIDVPRDISVLGFDNISESKVVSPELTTMQVKKRNIAKQTLELLFPQIENTSLYETRHIQVNTGLIERESCTHPKSQ